MKRRPIFLAVDDDPLNLSIMAEILEDDYEFHTLDSGEEVLETARKLRPDIVLLDIMMPGIDGYEVCRRLRAASDLTYMKIILVSARGRTEERLHGYEVGADDYIVKPFDLDEFKAKIEVFLRLKSTEEVNDLKGKLLQLFDHDTRTPLTGIIGAAEMLLTGAATKEQAQELHEIILQSGKRLQLLFERVSLLNSLRTENEDLSPVPVDMDLVVNTQLEAAASKFLEKGVTVDSIKSNDIRVLAEESFLKIILDSILDNAVHYSPQGGKVEVTVDANQRDAFLKVTDHGPGIQAEYMSQIFEGLSVAHLDNHGQGQGLSLAISKAMAELMGGDITVVSDPGQGACFEVRLPLAA